PASRVSIAARRAPSGSCPRTAARTSSVDMRRPMDGDGKKVRLSRESYGRDESTAAITYAGLLTLDAKPSYPRCRVPIRGADTVSLRLKFWKQEEADAASDEMHARPGLLADFILGSQDGLVHGLAVILGGAIAAL